MSAWFSSWEERCRAGRGCSTWRRRQALARGAHRQTRAQPAPGAGPGAGNTAEASFGGAYTGLPAYAGVDRGNFPHDYSDIVGAVEQLAYVTNPSGARPTEAISSGRRGRCCLLIQATSEAARFYDINGVFRAAMIGASTITG
ncbi:ribosome-inactivating family protein [Kitasatospora sp. NPDC001175]|uniref:ribosome-inactivating family protein n=1 Tax=Kitasatospora sp. NPDC001175 TaxID=3157103 RepID=UPI003D03F879